MDARRKRPTARLDWLGVVALAAVLGAGCDRNSRPDVGAWEARWRQVHDHLPSRDDIITAEDPRAVCSRALAYARDAERRLFPGPDEVIEATARKWLAVVLAAYMRCDAEGDHPDLDAAFERATVIERELDATLRAARE